MDTVALQTFASVVTAIVLEATPFLLLGSLLAGILEVFAADGALLRFVPRHPLGQVALGLAAGIFLPTCECGVVPVARKLMRKGAPPGVAIPFLLSAPVFNPVSLLATWVAFRGDWSVVALRVCLVAVPAVILGLGLARSGTDAVLRNGAGDGPGDDCGACCGHDHEHDHGHQQACDCGAPAQGNRLLSCLRHTAEEFLDMGRFLILGAAVSGLFKAFFPQGLLAQLSGSLPLAVLALMVLAFLLSVCSEADAFVAASLTMFPRPAQLAFMALGPMLDLKLLPAYFSVFQRRVAVALVVVPALIIYVLALSLGLAGV